MTSEVTVAPSDREPERRYPGECPGLREVGRKAEVREEGISCSGDVREGPPG